jgi:hypothetical protein
MELLSAPKKKIVKDSVRMALTVIGGITVIVAIIWVGIRGLSLFPNVNAFLANAVSGIRSVFVPTERIVIGTVDSQIAVNKPFTLVWEHRGNTSDGTYTFSYECQGGVFLARRDEGMQKTIFCNTEVPIKENETEIGFVAIGSVPSVAEIPVKITFTRAGQLFASVSGEAKLLVQSEYFDTATSTEVVTKTPEGATTIPHNTNTNVQVPQQHTMVPVVTQPFSDPNGSPDLFVRVLGYGLVDQKTGVFTELDKIPYNLPSGKRGALRFLVVNLGTKESGTWEFSVDLPTSPSYTYKSDKQQTLFPGDRIEYTIGFDSIRKATHDEYRIVVDPKNKVHESNEANNIHKGIVIIEK